MADKKKQKQDNRDVFEKALDGIDEPLGMLGPLAGAVIGARLTGGKFGRNKRVFRDSDLNFQARALGAGTGGFAGAIAGTALDQKYGLGKYGRDKRKTRK